MPIWHAETTYYALVGTAANKVASPKKLKVETLQHQPVYGPGLMYRQKTGRCEVQNLLQLFPCIRGKHRTVFLRVAAGLPQSLLGPCPRAPREHSGSQCTVFRVTGTQNWGISMFQRQVMQQVTQRPQVSIKDCALHWGLCQFRVMRYSK